MKKYLKLLLLWITVLAGGSALGQSNILRAEYFIQTDPGLGLGTPVTISQGTALDVDFQINTTDMAFGSHKVYVRTQDALGLWSIPVFRYFFVIDPTDRVYQPLDYNLVAAEYFVDADPGVGRGTSIDLSAGTTADQDLAFTVSDLTPGIHYLYLRCKQSDGVWGHAKKTPFFVMGEEDTDIVAFNTDIIAAEYFFDTDPGTGKGFALPVQKTDTITTRPWSASTQGLSAGKHRLYLRTQNQDGVWNMVKATKVFIYASECNMPVADFSFDTVAAGVNIGLTDLSANVVAGATYKWDVLGDGVIESTASDYDLSFETNGVYPIRLTVTNSEGCFTSIVKDVLVTDMLPGSLTLSANDSLLVGDTLIISASSGFDYEWSTQATSQSVYVVSSGSYYTFLSHDGITFKSESVSATFFEPIQLEIDVHQATSGLSNGAARISLLETDGLPYTITWSTGSQNTEAINGLSAGTYTLTVKTALETKNLNIVIADGEYGANSLIAAEYFVDEDPGAGMGTPINIYQDNSVDFDFSINFTDYTAGSHDVYIRTKNTNGVWGSAIKRNIYLFESGGIFPEFSYGGNIIYAEYAIDTLPVPGMGTSIAITPGLELDQMLAVDLTGLETGAHKIFIQMRDASGNWSFSDPVDFTICNEVPAAPAGADINGCPMDDFTLTVTGSGGTFNWFDAEDQQIISGGSASLNIYNIEESTSYFVTEINTEGCESARTEIKVNIAEAEIFAGPDVTAYTTQTRVLLKDGYPKGGSWSAYSYVDTNGYFLPGNSGVGTYEVTYTLDSAGCALTDTKNVVVKTINNSAPVVNNASFMIDENAISGALVGTITATDAESDAITFVGASSSDTLNVSIGLYTGNITVKNPAIFDYELNSSFDFSVIISDPYHDEEVLVSIFLNDMEDLSDSLVLVALYDSTGGPDWTSQMGWFTGPVSSWQGIQLDTDGRITAIDLSANGLTGAIPASINNLTALTSLDFSENDLTGLPLIYLPNLTSLDVSVNRLEFDALEYNAEVSGLNYASQKPVGEMRSDTIHIGGTAQLHVAVGGQANLYTWTFNGTNTVVEDALTSELIIDDLDYSVMGSYVLTITNELIPDLTLTSQEQIVLVSADLLLSASGLGQTFTSGTGYAFRVSTEPGVPYDTVAQVTGGQIVSDLFVFDDLVLGDYLLAVKPDLLDEFIVTYYPGTDLWVEADELIFRTDSTLSMTMVQIPDALPVNPDAGVVKGSVESDFADETTTGRVQSRKKVQRAACSMRKFQRTGRTLEDGTWTLYAYVESDDDGNFRFENIEEGRYRFNIEYPGIPMDTTSFVEFEVGADGVEKNTFTLQAVVTEEGIVVTKINELGFYRKYFKDLTVYPNPVQNELHIGYSKLLHTGVMLRVVDLQGRTVKEKMLESGYDINTTIDVSTVPNGIYLVNFIDTTSKNNTVITVKVIVAH